MVYSAYGIPRAMALTVQKTLAALLSYRLKREYSETCKFVKTRVSPAIVRDNSLLLHGLNNKGACIRQRPDLTDGAMMALLAPWHG